MQIYFRAAICTLICLIQYLDNQAWADLPVPDVSVVTVKSGEPIGWVKAKAKWSAQSLPNGFQDRKFIVDIRVSKKFKLTNVKLETSDVQMKRKGQRIRLTTDAMSIDLKLYRSKRKFRRIRVQLSVGMQEVQVNGCDDLQIKIVSDPLKIPYYNFVDCKLEDGNHLVFFSFPSDSTIEKATIVEKEGKGESWLLFDMGKLLSATGELGEFSFGFRDEKINFKILSEKETPQKKQELNNYAIGLGYAQLNTKETVEASHSTPSLVAWGLPRQIWSRLALSIKLVATIELGESDESISFLQISPMADFDLISHQSWKLAPLVSFSMTSQKQKGSGVSYQVFQGGAGLSLGTQLSKYWWLYLTGRTDALGSEEIDAHFFGELLVLNRGLEEEIGYGFGLETQSISVIDSEENLTKYDTLIGYFMVTY